MSKVSKFSPMKLRKRPGWLVQTDYDEVFVGQLQTMIPKRDRWFCKPRRGWWIAEEWKELVEHLVRDAFGAIKYVDADGREIIVEASGEKLEQGRLL